MGQFLPTISPAGRSPSTSRPRISWTFSFRAFSATPSGAGGMRFSVCPSPPWGEGLAERARRLESIGMTRPTRLLLPLLFGAAVLGCDQTHPPQPPPPGPAEVLVSQPVTREVTDYEEFPGQTEAIPMVEIRARVTGYLSRVYFKDGADVNEGDLLFEIDPRPYQAALDRAQATLVQSDVHLKRLDADYQRAQNLYPKGA